MSITTKETKEHKGDLIVIEDRVDMQCIRHVHLMANVEFDEACMSRYTAVNGLVMREAGVWHLRAVYPLRGVIDIPAACVEGKVRRLVVWSLTPPLTPPHLSTNGEGKK